MKAFWTALPEEFEAKDFKTTAQEVGLSIPTAERYIRQWVDTPLTKSLEVDTKSGNNNSQSLRPNSSVSQGVLSITLPLECGILKVEFVNLHIQ